jgi:hypothetical protein
MHCRLDRRGRRAHRHDDPLGPRIANVLERLVAATGTTCEPKHRLLEQARYCSIEGARGLTPLEEHIWILGGAAQARVVGRERPLLQRSHLLLVDQRA